MRTKMRMITGMRTREKIMYGIENENQNKN